ncbi:BLOC-1-related complex subunit 6 [Cylas formicarius]|uniref:BLOC-1-related complex subunit 6 n=1 Tax=Cylas formicarius TaxID=197179 RepID=UPI002958DC6B|nr:BLOC-1-related complex subunit 6 [Cylas formicarius]
MESDQIKSPSPPPPSEPPPSLPPPVPARPQKLAEPAEEVHKNDCAIDDDEISQHMTQSYSEISFKSGLSPENDNSIDLNLDSIEVSEHFIKRPETLSYEAVRPLNLDGTVHKEGNMTHFVAEDLETKIKLSSPVSKKNDTPGNSRSGTPSSLYKQILTSQMSQLDTTLINDLEVEAQRMATSVDSLIENLSGILHSISSITVDNVDVYKSAVLKMSDAMDSNIKSMYTMMAKVEEVTQLMKNMETMSVKLKEIRKLVDLFESFL